MGYGEKGRSVLDFSDTSSIYTAAVELAVALGARNIHHTPGCWTHEMSNGWVLVINGHDGVAFADLPSRTKIGIAGKTLAIVNQKGDFVAIGNSRDLTVWGPLPTEDDVLRVLEADRVALNDKLFP